MKIFLHVSKDEQRRRFLERLDDPDKNWKFSAADIAERAMGRVPGGLRRALIRHVHSWAPWYVVPADHKYALRALVGGIVAHAIDAMDLSPPPSPDGG